MINLAHKLEQQVAAGLKGDFITGWRLAQELEEEFPNSRRAAFNRGWYLLMQGKLQDGHNLLDQGRFINVYGNGHIGSPQPIWKRGEKKGTILLNLEGGLGDQIVNYRYAFDLKKLGNKVVITCSPELVKLFSDDFIIAKPEIASGIYHDYWLPAMSAVVALDYEYKDISGKPYIKKTKKTIKGRIGVRWNGNPQFEHEQHRLFPSDLIFDTVKGYDCVSLQRDTGAELKPDWMPQADVNTWDATRDSISECELVITSCTSVAHLASSMGIKTWIVTPILPYYLWALPGNKTPYYNNVTLFRQEKYGDWKKPFDKIKEELECTRISKMK